MPDPKASSAICKRVCFCASCSHHSLCDFIICTDAPRMIASSKLRINKGGSLKMSRDRPVLSLSMSASDVSSALRTPRRDCACSKHSMRPSCSWMNAACACKRKPCAATSERSSCTDASIPAWDGTLQLSIFRLRLALGVKLYCAKSQKGGPGLLAAKHNSASAPV